VTAHAELFVTDNTQNLKQSQSSTKSVPFPREDGPSLQHLNHGNGAGCKVAAHAELFVTDNTQNLQAEPELLKKSSTSTGVRVITATPQPCRWLRI